MIGEGVSSVWIGASTDSRYAELTAVMLSSLDDNGQVPEATVIVADFDLRPGDRSMLRDAAGSLGASMRFHSVTPQSPEIVAVPVFKMPFPLMGRFVVPQLITTPGARLLLLDSDMIVNRSLRQLFETHMRGHAVAAVHDSISWREHYGREPKDHYFNAGMMMIDIDRYREADIAARAMRRLASYGDPPPMWLDQDALNEVIGENWLALDRRWNFFHAADYRGFDHTDYERADIVHFSGPKPWEDPNHPAIAIYDRAVGRMWQKVTCPKPNEGGSSRLFIATCYEMLLGRELETDTVLAERAGLSPERSLGCILDAPEFEAFVIEPLRNGTPFSDRRFPGAPSLAQRYWAADCLPILRATAPRLLAAATWRELLRALLADRYFVSWGGLSVLAEDAAQR